VGVHISGTELDKPLSSFGLDESNSQIHESLEARLWAVRFAHQSPRIGRANATPDTGRRRQKGRVKPCSKQPDLGPAQICSRDGETQRDNPFHNAHIIIERGGFFISD